LLVALAMPALLVACSGDGGGPVGTNVPQPATTIAPATPSTSPQTTTPISAPTTTAISVSPSDAIEPDPGAAPSGTALVAPAGDAFYEPPDPIPGSNGDLIWARPLEPAPPGTVAWQVLYRSESVAGDPIAVSGVVVGPAASDGSARPVLSWAHGTTGLGDQCAPSRTYTGGGGIETILAIGVVSLGFTFVATDYEGLGTPGVHPYLVGQSEGRGVLDIVRAAAQIEGTGATADSPVAIFGHSQGGHAALMAAELATAYAPELAIVGTVAVAPPGDLALIERGTSAAGEMLAGGFGMMLDAGFAAAYPDLPADALVSPEGLDVLEAIGEVCTAEAFGLAADATGVQRDGTENPDWLAVFEANSPGNVAPSAPVLIIHGGADDVVPPLLSELVEADYCALDVQVQRTVYPDADHGSVVTQGLAEAQAWITARLAGEPAPTTC
jgi:pimeloyl-ACP methyl ester carboxylesterase